MRTVTLTSENEKNLQLVIDVAQGLGIEVQPGNTTIEDPPVRPVHWYGSISKEAGRQLRDEADRVRREDWER